MNDYITSTFLEYPDNYSIATIVYFSGCGKSCVGCHNTTLKDYIERPNNLPNMIMDYCYRIGTNKIVLCGGDPLFEKNLPLTKKVVRELHTFDICIYTGFDPDEAKDTGIFGFKFIKCGFYDPSKFIGSKKTDDFIQFATSNQKLFDKDFNLLSKDGVYFF